MKNKKNLIEKFWVLICIAIFVYMFGSSIYFVIIVHSKETFLLLALSLLLAAWVYFFTIRIEAGFKKGREGKGWMHK